MTAMNIFPELMKELYEHMINRRMNEAILVRNKILKRITDMFEIDSDTRLSMDFMLMMRMEMEKIQPMLTMGPMRRPQITMNRMWWL